jgi:hypothetical protein
MQLPREGKKAFIKCSNKRAIETAEEQHPATSMRSGHHTPVQCMQSSCRQNGF